MVKKESVVRFKFAVIVLNCLLASITLINLYTVAAGAVAVDIPEQSDFAWTLDTKTEEATFQANFTVENMGLYDISDLDIRAKVISERGNELVDYVQKDLLIRNGEKRAFDIAAKMPFENIDLAEWRGLMVNDSVFFLDVDIRARYLWGLGTFVVDDVLEYPWEAPMNHLANDTDEDVVELLKYAVSGDADFGGLVDGITDEVAGSPLLNNIEWDGASLRIESTPVAENTSLIVSRLTLDVLEGRHTITFEIVLVVEREVDGYDISFEGFSLDYR